MNRSDEYLERMIRWHNKETPACEEDRFDKDWYAMTENEQEEVTNRWVAWLNARPAIERHREAAEVLSNPNNFRIGAPKESLENRRQYWLAIWKSTLAELTPEQAREELAKHTFEES